MRMTSKASLLCAALLSAAVFAGSPSREAFAGPQMTFGPNDEGVLQIDYKGQFQLTVRDTGSGPEKQNSTVDFNFRRNRIALMGKYGDVLGIYVQTEFLENQNVTPFTVRDEDTGKDFQLIDAIMRFHLDDRLNVNVGKFKYSFSRENLEACEAPLTLDRSLFIRVPYVSTRDKGVGIWGNFLDDRLQYRADITQGRTATDAADPAPASYLRYGVRGHVSLLDPEKDYGYKGTYLGKKKVLTAGAAYQYEPKVAYADTVAEAGAQDYKAWTADLFFEYPFASAGTVTLSGAYEDVDLGDVYKGANPDTGALGINGQKRGWYGKAGYLLPGLPLQLFGRYEDWKFASLNNDADEAPAENVFDQEVKWYGVGANYYLRGQNLKLTFEYSKTDFDKENATTRDFNTFVTQLQVVF